MSEFRDASQKMQNYIQICRAFTKSCAIFPEVSKIAEIVRDNFDLTPAGLTRSLDLLRPIYQKTAAYGHFGRELPEFTWEKTDKAQLLRQAAGL